MKRREYQLRLGLAAGADVPDQAHLIALYKRVALIVSQKTKGATTLSN
jgi:hypothetical protein